jgi:hypothetical protein
MDLVTETMINSTTIGIVSIDLATKTNSITMGLMGAGLIGIVGRSSFEKYNLVRDYFSRETSPKKWNYVEAREG